MHGISKVSLTKFCFADVRDRFSLEHPTEEEKAQQKGYEFYRIIILPWPRYTQAADEATQKKDITATSHGEFIEGKIYATVMKDSKNSEKSRCELHYNNTVFVYNDYIANIICMAKVEYG